MRDLVRNSGFLAIVAMIAVFVIGNILGVSLFWIAVAALVIFVAAAAQVNGAYVWRRVLLLVPVVLLVTFFTFMLVSLLPGEAAVNLLGPGATPEAVEELNERMGLNDPVIPRYFKWLGNAATGDLGESPFLNEPVTEGLGRTMPISLQLMFYAQVLSLVIAIPLGVLTAYRSGSLIDKVVGTTAFGFLAIPNFVLAILLILFFALDGVRLFGIDWGTEFFPASRYKAWGDDKWLHVKHMALPTLSLALGQIAVYMRLLRTDMIATLQEDFINVAKAKGMGTMKILFGHALRPSSFTLLTVVGINIGALIGGSLIIETLFTLPSVGTYIVTAIFQRDFIVIQGVVVVIAIGFVLANFAVDLLYASLDPRIRHARTML